MLKPVYALVDCNNFFVSCERVFRPDLWDKPVAVLSNNDGCIVARSNEVKALGIPMAVPYFKVSDVLKQNNVTLFSGNFQLYGDFSQRVTQILQQESPDIEVYSVDESFLEISSLPIKDYEAWARTLKAKIFKWTGIPVSIGIAPTKTLAKAAADFAKKNESTEGGFSIVGDDTKHLELLKWLPIGDVWGIGWRTTPKLQEYGIRTAYDISLASDTWVQSQLNIRGVKTAHELKGESCYELESNNEPQKSIAHTRSFPHAVRNYYELEGAIATFAAQTAAKLRSQQELAGAVMTFLRTSKYTKIQHSGSHVVTLLPPTAETGKIVAAALEGLQAIYDPDFGYKKGGITLFDLKPRAAWQLELGGNIADIDRQAALMATIDQLNNHYHTRLVRHAIEHTERSDWRSRQQQRSPNYTTNWAELPIIKAS
ncbi:MAG TPA: Y-family DNA polymerase [Patescibacteria group bacterium]|jgi:DNA polymerase V|nr:Y-family DNA polymerase [Patescibacteria group bacterium]